MRVKAYFHNGVRLVNYGVTATVVLPDGGVLLVAVAKDEQGLYVPLDASYRLPGSIDSAVGLVRMEFRPAVSEKDAPFGSILSGAACLRRLTEPSGQPLYAVEATSVDLVREALLSLYAEYPGLVPDSCRALFPVENLDSAVSARLADQALQAPEQRSIATQ